MKIKCNVSMKTFTSLKIGGPADVLIDVENIKELKIIKKFAYKNRMPMFILGRGTNILVKDKGIRGIVVRLKKEFEKFNFCNTKVRAGAGGSLSGLIRESSNRGLSGLEFLAGIPGTVGAACILNAGARGGEIGDRVLRITCLTKEGKLKKISKKYIKFNYRYTNLLEEKIIITEVELKLYKDKRENCENRIRDFINRRKQTQPLGFPNAGCIFKNPNFLPAGRLIESCGLKGIRIGDVEVSKAHANFVINRGRGTARDVIKLINLIENKVKKKFKIKLEKEIQIVGE